MLAHRPADIVRRRRASAKKAPRAHEFMTIDQRILATEKALLLLALGFIEAFRHRALHEDEAFYTIGIPLIIGRMQTFGISSEVIDIVAELDEYELLSQRCNERKWQATMESAAERCRTLLAAMPLQTFIRPNDFRWPCLRLLEQGQYGADTMRPSAGLGNA
jgi:hypothetical protein